MATIHSVVGPVFSLVLAVQFGAGVPAAALEIAAKDTRDDPFKGDTRLDQQLRISVEGMALSDVLARLSSKTGVSLSASRVAADDKIMVFSRGRKLRETLTGIASLFNDHWERKTDDAGRPSYLITRAAAAQKYESSLLQSMNNRMIADLEAQVRALRETPEQLKRRDEKDPVREQLSNADGRLATLVYGALNRNQAQELFSVGRLRVPFSMLPYGVRQALREAAANSVRTSLQDPDFFHTLTIENYVDHNLDWLEAAGARFKIVRDPVDNKTSVELSLGPYGSIHLRGLSESAEWVFPVLGRPYPKDPGHPEAAGEDMFSTPQAAAPPIEAIRAASREESVADRLRVLSEAVGLPIIADYYRTKARPDRRYSADPPASGETVQALNELAAKDGRLWWSEGKTLFLRARNWFERRLYEVPDRWLSAVSAKLISQDGKPTYADLQRLADLTPRQIQGMMTGHSRNLTFTSEFDLYFQPGLHELLAVLKPQPWPFGKEDPIIDQRLSTEAEERATLTWEKMTPVQRASTPAFLGAQDQMMQTAPLETTRVFINVRGRGSSPAQFISVFVSCKLGQAHAGDDPFSDKHAEYDLFLPVSLADDRRSKTSIEILGRE